MKSTTNIIKYFAIAFAAILIVGIITGAVFLINAIFGIKTNQNLETHPVSATISEFVEIDLKATNLIINKSDEFGIETNNDYIKINNREGKLVIKEEKHNFLNNTNFELILNIPNTILNELDIDAGAGSIKINDINALDLSLDLGAGKVEIDNLNITKEVSIDGGAGEINITNSNLTNLDLDMGVGKCTINGTLSGNSDIDAGVGELNLNLSNNLNNYSIKVNKGIGKIILNNQELNNKESYGTGNNNIYIDGGIGKIDITTK